MPEMDGYELAEIIQSGYANSKTPIIFISGVFFDEMSVFKGYRTGAVDYLTKPLNMNILVSKVQIFLQLYEVMNELEREKAKSVQSLEEKTMAIGTISHEIRNPLGAISSIVEVLEMECSNHELLSYIHIMKSSADHMNRLLNDLIDYSKIESGYIVLDKTQFNLQEEIDLIVQSFKFQTNISNNNFEFSIDKGIPKELIGDITRYKQILYNLLGNANKFTRNGDIKLNISSMKISDDHILLVTDVTDNGIGMTEEEQKELFIPFSQSNKGIKQKFGGSGLGLSIAKDLSNVLGGDIKINSEKEKGSTFSFSAKFQF
jgi:signal transduction histidine kinase